MGKGIVLTLALAVAHVIIGVQADCDRSGMCRQMVNIINDEEDDCHTKLDCVKTYGIDCMNDMALFNRFACNAADCIEIAAVLKGGADEDACAENFPQVVGTSMERSSGIRGEMEGPKGSWKQKFGSTHSAPTSLQPV